MSVDHFARKIPISFCLSFRRIAVDHQVLAIDVTKALKFLEIDGGAEVSPDPHFGNPCRRVNNCQALLRSNLWRRGSASPEREHRRSNKELPSSHLFSPRELLDRTMGASARHAMSHRGRHFPPVAPFQLRSRKRT